MNDRRLSNVKGGGFLTKNHDNKYIPSGVKGANAHRTVACV
jgi:hypothetical protein